MTDGYWTRRRLSRRRFLAGAGFAAGTAALWLAGCREGPEALPSTPGTSDVRGGTLRLSIVGDPPSFDIHQETTITALQPLTPAYNGLVTYNEQKPEEIVGDLAETFEVADNGLRYIFRLRPNIKWHDGSDFTAEDAAYNIRRMASPPQGVVSARKEQFAVLDRVETPDLRTVVLLFREPYSSFLAQFATDWFLMFPPRIIEAKGHMKQDVMGTGPFRLQNWTPGSSIDLVRNEHYFKPGLPRADALQTLIIADSNTRFEALRTGRINMTGRIFAVLTPSQARLLQGSDDVKVAEAPGLGSPWYLFNAVRGPFADPRVRRAVWIAFDRQAAIQVLEEGYGSLGTFLPPGPWEYPRDQRDRMPGYRSRQEDLAEARRLLQAAGYSSGFPVKVFVRDVVRQAGELMAQQLALLGLQPQIQVFETARQAEVRQRKEFDIEVLQNVYRINDPDELARKVLTDAAQNDGGYSNPQVDQLFAAQRRELNQQRRLQLVRQLDELLMQEAPQLMPYWNTLLMGYRREVVGFQLPAGQYNGNRLETLAVAR
jgi:peptide/nickel transport system substrate-binding protein